MAAGSPLLVLTSDIVAAHASSNTVSASELPQLIRSVHDALAALGRPAEAAEEEFVPAVSIRKSLASPDAIISMIDGKPYSMLKRHLTRHGLTPQQYRQRYNLPIDYPMVAPSYAAKRKELAHKSGLGRKPAPAPEPVVEEAPKRGRRKLGIGEALTRARGRVRQGEAAAAE